MKINTMPAKSIITKSNLPDADFVINPYIGCAHACIYCYADFMKRFTGHTEPWGTFVDVKEYENYKIKNIKKYDGKTIVIGSVTDPYMPIESKYMNTKKILENIVDMDSHIEILTKSKLVTRDIEIFKKFKDVHIGISLNTLDEKVASRIEPGTSKSLERLETLKILKENNIKTFLFISPIFPYITNIEELVDRAKGNVNYVIFENLNIRGNNKERIYEFLQTYDKNLISEYDKIYFDKKYKKEFWNKVHNEIEDICKGKNIKYKIYFNHLELEQ